MYQTEMERVTMEELAEIECCEANNYLSAGREPDPSTAKYWEHLGIFRGPDRHYTLSDFGEEQY